MAVIALVRVCLLWEWRDSADHPSFKDLGGDVDPWLRTGCLSPLDPPIDAHREEPHRFVSPLNPIDARREEPPGFVSIVNEIDSRRPSIDSRREEPLCFMELRLEERT
jgi:hypothetical protein